IKRRDILQLAPNVNLPGRNEENEDETHRGSDLFTTPAAEPRIFSRIARWAETFRPPSPEPLELNPSAVDKYRSCPQLYLFSKLWLLQEGPRATLTFGRVMHSTIKRVLLEMRRGHALPFDEVQRIFETEWSTAGFEDDYQEGEYKKDGLEQ